MSLGSLAVNRPVAMLMLMAFVLLLGLVSLTNLQMDLLPKISPPVLAVITRMPNAAPSEIATLITEPLESVVGTASGLQRISSRSQESSSLIILEFDWGINLDGVREEIKDRVEMIPLPNGATKPMVVKFDPTSMPVLQLSVTADKDLNEIQKYVEEVVAPKLDSIPGVASVDISGGLNREIRIEPIVERLLAYNIKPENLGKMIALNNLSLPAHLVNKDQKNLPVRVMGQYESVDDLKSMVVAMDFNESMTPVYLKDVAKIEDTFAPLSSYNRTNGRQGINLSIQKEGDSNLVTVAQGVLEAISNLERNTDYTFTVAMNQGEIVEDSIRNIAQNLVMGAILAILILLIFLKSPLSTLIIAVSIPFSIVATFVLMYFTGLTLNLMTLGGLALGVGMLVDNSIVVIENIYRHLQNGEETKEAAKNGADEVSMAIIASTLTTMAVFLPVVFVGGLTGELFGELALTVAFSLLASLVVALTVIPMLASILLKYRKGKIKKFKPWKYYGLLLSYPLKYRAITLMVTLTVFLLSVFQFNNIGREFIPEIDEGSFFMNLSLEEGTNLEATNQEVEKIEAILKEFSEVKTVSVRVGSTGGLTGAPRTNTAEINVVLDRELTGSLSTNDFMEGVRAKLDGVKGAVTFSQQNEMQAMAGSSELQIILQGPSLEGVQQESERIVEALNGIEQLTDVKSNLESTKPEAQVIIKEESLPLFGLTTAQVAQATKLQLDGETITFLNENGNRTEIKMVHPKRGENNFQDLGEIEIVTPMGGTITLDQVAEIKEGYGPRTIYRENQKVTAQIQGKIIKGDLGTIQRQVNTIIEELALPPGYSISYSGAAQMMEEGFQGLKFALILAIALVYMIMAAQFESLLNPFIIIFTIPFAMIGVITSLLITGRALGITAFIGIIMLAGIVVNNGIVMVDYINKLRRGGLGKSEAIVEGAQTRVRPILMTTLTTILALIPLALGIGEGAELQAPMATVVIGGLMVSTLLTLIVIPVLYSLLSPKKI